LGRDAVFLVLGFGFPFVPKGFGYLNLFGIGLTPLAVGTALYRLLWLYQPSVCVSKHTRRAQTRSKYANYLYNTSTVSTVCLPACFADTVSLSLWSQKGFMTTNTVTWRETN
jgi:hypothetical protein